MCLLFVLLLLLCFFFIFSFFFFFFFFVLSYCFFSWQAKFCTHPSLFLVLSLSMNCRPMHPHKILDSVNAAGSLSCLRFVSRRNATCWCWFASRELASKISPAKIDDGWRYPRWIRGFSEFRNFFLFSFLLPFEIKARFLDSSSAKHKTKRSMRTILWN